MLPQPLTLPAVPPRDQPLPVPDLRPANPLVEPPSFAFEPASWRVTRDHSAGTVEVQLRANNATRLPDGTLYHAQSEATTSVDEARPAKASIVGVSTLLLEAPERTTVSRARGEIRSDETNFHVTVQLDVTIDGTPYHSRRWSRSYRRNLL